MKSLLAASAACLTAALIFFTGFTWGLPRPEVNAYLFGSHPVWTGQQIITLAGGWDATSNLGADVDRDPIARRDVVVPLNDTDAKRAEIVRRYRLFSSQPDEMITFTALAKMQPAHLRIDPELYQYGGLWVYPVGALLQAAASVHLVTLRGDLAYYLDHPDAFGRFYIVARAYSATWGLVGVCVVFALARRLGAVRPLAVVAAIGFALLPAVVNAAHEAKPHLAGTTLVLAAALAAMSPTGQLSRRRAIVVAVLAGGAVAMVPTGGVAICILPVSLWLSGERGKTLARRVGIGTAISIAVYAVCNPFVIVHLVYERGVLTSNAGNTSAMYSSQGWLDGAINAGRLIGAAGGWTAVGAGIVGWLSLGLIDRARLRSLTPLLVAGVLTAIVFAIFAAGKPGEYGRFFALPVAVLWIGVIALLSRWRLQPLAFGVAFLLTLCSAAAAWPYVRACLRDANHIGTRDELAGQFAKVSGVPMTVALRAEPAPYSMPAVDLFSLRLMLVPAGTADPAVEADWLIRAADVLDTPPAGWDARWSKTGGPGIAWADKPFDVWRRVR